MARLFGTDGVRGVANADLTPELAFRVGRAGAWALSREIDAHRPFVVARDTRLSGSMLEAAVVAGIASSGRDALSVGIAPTPAVPVIVRSIGATGRGVSEAAICVATDAERRPGRNDGMT